MEEGDDAHDELIEDDDSSIEDERMKKTRSQIIFIYLRRLLSLIRGKKCSSQPKVIISQNHASGSKYAS